MKPRWPEVVVTHAVLLFMSAVVLYPVLWVLKLALTPGGQIGTDPSAFPLPASFDLDNIGAFLFAKDFNGNPLF